MPLLIFLSENFENTFIDMNGEEDASECKVLWNHAYPEKRLEKILLLLVSLATREI